MAGVFLHASPQVLLPGGVLVHQCYFGGEASFEDCAEELFFAFKMPEESHFIDPGFASDLPGCSALDTFA